MSRSQPNPSESRAPSAGPPWTRALPLLVFAVAFLAFAPALQQGFVLGDDDYNLVHNPRWRGWSAEHLRWMWTTGHLGHYQPLAWMSFALELALWGEVSPERMHLTNLLLHAGSAVLAHFLLVRLLVAGFGGVAPGERGPLHLAAAAGALLYAVHPLRVESVAWATERRDVLSCFFLLATVLAWLRHLDRGGRRWLAAALALYVASLLSKAWGMTLPAVLLVLDWHPLRRHAGPLGRRFARLALEKLWLAPLAVAGAGAAAWAQAGDAATVPLAQHGPLARVAQACYGLVFYLAKTLWPTDLSTLYLLRLPLDPAQPVYVASMAAVAALTVGLWLARRAFPAGLAAWLCYMILVSPVLGFLQSGLQLTADRYTYLAALPWSALAAAGLFVLARRPARAAWALGGAAAVVALLAATTWRQTLVWKSSVSLWARAVEVEPDNYIAQHNLAASLHQEQDLQGALEHVQRSLALEPGRLNTRARFLLGGVHLGRGDFEAALAAWRELLALDPGDEQALRAVQRELGLRGRSEEATVILGTSFRLRPDLVWLGDELARLSIARGDRAGAERIWAESLERDPTWRPALQGMFRHLLEQGRVAEAEERVRAALAADPADAAALVLLGRLHASQGRDAQAEEAWSRVLALQPAHAEARSLLIRLRQGRGP